MRINEETRDRFRYGCSLSCATEVMAECAYTIQTFLFFFNHNVFFSAIMIVRRINKRKAFVVLEGVDHVWSRQRQYRSGHGGFH